MSRSTALSLCLASFGAGARQPPLALGLGENLGRQGHQKWAVEMGFHIVDELTPSGMSLQSRVESAMRQATMINFNMEGFLAPSSPVSSISGGVTNFEYTLALTQYVTNTTFYLGTSPWYGPHPFRGDEAMPAPTLAQEWDYFMNAHSRLSIRSIAQEAFKHDELRVLFPFVSHSRFCLSRSLGYPFDSGLPWIEKVPERDLFSAFVPDGKYLASGALPGVIGAVVTWVNAQRAG